MFMLPSILVVEDIFIFGGIAMNKKKLVLVAVVLVAFVAAFVGIYAAFAPKPVEGAKAIVVEVVDAQGQVVTYNHRTDQEYLVDVFEEIEDLTVEGEQGPYGLYIQKVNGLQAIYEVDQAYWSLYVDHEYGQNGADTQVVIDGTTYTLAYEKAQ